MAHSGNSKEHYDQLFLAQNRMSDECVGKPDKPSSSFLNECGIGRKMISIDYVKES